MRFLQNALIHLGVFFPNIKTLLDCRSASIILCGVLLVTVQQYIEEDSANYSRPFPDFLYLFRDQFARITSIHITWLAFRVK